MKSLPFTVSFTGIKITLMTDGRTEREKVRIRSSDSARAHANTIKHIQQQIQQPLTVLHAECADNPERKERHDEHVQVSGVRVVP